MVGTILKNPAEGFENRFAGNYDIVPEDRIPVGIYLGGFIFPKWDGSIWFEAASNQEIQEYNKNRIPLEISRMKFELQLYITTTVRDENNNIVQLGKTFQDIIDYINSLQMSSFYKNLLKMRLLSCVTLERDNDDLNALAPGMGISQEQLDSIFVNGNLIE